ncbi:putative membrane protein [Prauserella halophila]|nr:putative membrane protein [Prauserella halophila]
MASETTSRTSADSDPPGGSGHDPATGFGPSPSTRAVAAAAILLCGITLVFGLLNKHRCTGPEFDENGRSTPNYAERNYHDACYSDIQFLWLGRDVDNHVFPYVHGDITADGQLVGGTLEYPVLTGVLIWAGAVFADTDAEFLLWSAVLLAPFGLVTAWLLGRLAGWRALLWALGPPLVLYGFHNWDLPVVAASVAAFFVLHRTRGSLRSRAGWAAVLLGAGTALKLYPGLFVVPLALYVFVESRRGAESSRGAESRRGGETGRSVREALSEALRVPLLAGGVVAAVNLPFVLAGFDGWWASIEFQGQREADVTTNSIWYWGVRHLFSSDVAFQQFTDVVSPLAVLTALALACGIGWDRARREGSFPLLPVCAAALCGFLLLHKVHSPQYTLWLLPMFVLLRVRWGWIAAYLVADVALGVGVFRWYGDFGQSIADGFAAQAVVIGVWGKAALLVGLFAAFLGARAVTDHDPARSLLPGHRPFGADSVSDSGDRRDAGDRDRADRFRGSSADSPGTTTASADPDSAPPSGSSSPEPGPEGQRTGSADGR